VDYLSPTGTELSLMRQRLYKILFERQGITMSNSGIIQNPMKIGRRKTIRDSRRRGLNPQDLRTM
jgi:hypothetical protein